MAIMFGNGKVKTFGTGDKPYIMKTEMFVVSLGSSSAAVPVEGTDSLGWSASYEAPDGKKYPKINPKFYTESGEPISSSNATTTLVNGAKVFCSYDLAASGSVIEISANSFPGTYYVTGDTYARSETSGEDEFFQFVIPKAKVQSENTITLEAEGDPSVFNMSLRVLRPLDGKMMKLIKYELTNGSESEEDLETDLVHNHILNPVTE